MLLSLLLNLSARYDVEGDAGTLDKGRFAYFTASAMDFIFGASGHHARILGRLRLANDRADDFFFQWNVNAFFRRFVYKEYVIDVIAVYIRCAAFRFLVITFHRLGFLRSGNTRFLGFYIEVPYFFDRDTWILDWW